MPLDSITDEFVDEWRDKRWRDRAYWQVKFVLWPRRCEITDRLIWLELGYHGELWITGPGEPVSLTRWHDYREHLLWLLKG